MFKTVMAGATIALALTAGAGVAQADNGPFSGPMGDHDASAYWVDVSSVANGSLSSATGLAHIICSKLEQGSSEGDLIAVMAQSTTSNSMSAAKFAVHAAEWHFCPTYY
jgi:hypothetical protein